MNERQMELAQQLEQADREAGIARVRAALSAQQDSETENSGDCADCGTEIPETRRRLVPNATRCTPCQAHFEKRHRGNGR